MELMHQETTAMDMPVHAQVHCADAPVAVALSSLSIPEPNR